LKTKTINAVITKKINDWLNSIEDETVVKKIKNDIIVTGGCITSMLLNEPVNDFDIYFKTKESLKVISQYYIDKFNVNNADRKNKLNRPLHAWLLDGAKVEQWKGGDISLSDFAYDYPNIKYKEITEWTYDDENPNNNVCSRVSGMILNTPPERVKIMVNSDGIAEDSDSIADQSEYDIDKYLDALGDGDNIPEAEIDGNSESSKEKYKPISCLRMRLPYQIKSKLLYGSTAM